MMRKSRELGDALQEEHLEQPDDKIEAGSEVGRRTG